MHMSGQYHSISLWMGFILLMQISYNPCLSFSASCLSIPLLVKMIDLLYLHPQLIYTSRMGNNNWNMMKRKSSVLFILQSIEYRDITWWRYRIRSFVKSSLKDNRLSIRALKSTTSKLFLLDKPLNDIPQNIFKWEILTYFNVAVCIVIHFWVF